MIAEPSPISTAFIKALLAEDELGSVIRSHLYIEAQLSAFLELTVPQPIFLIHLKLSYAQKIDLACCLGFDTQFRGALKQIGKLRNGFAHDLTLSLSKQSVANLFSALPEFGRNAVHLSVSMLQKMCTVTPLPSKYDQLSPKIQFALVALFLERMCFASVELVQKGREK